mgnify:CR=1 FL=1
MERKTEIELTNMCLVYNDDAVLVQEKAGTKYRGAWYFRAVMLKKENI